MEPCPPRPTLFPYTTLFRSSASTAAVACARRSADPPALAHRRTCGWPRSEEHTSELQSRRDLVCRLLLEKKKQRQELHHISFHFPLPGRPAARDASRARGVA